jgi:TrmH family RNA methyltransferase
LRVDENAIFVALFQVSSPGNLGTILRTADATQARGVILIGNATDPYAPTALNASRGALFSVPLVQLQNANELLEWCHLKSVRIVTTSDQAARNLWDADLSAPVLLVFGNEGEGLPPEILARGQAVKIPMAGGVDSLNLAVAAGVLLYECVRRKSDQQQITDNGKP